MNQDQIKGGAKIVLGKFQEAVGNLLDSHKQVVLGISKQVAGRRQKGRGDIKARIQSYREGYPDLSRNP